ncbi:hypothetical protein ACFOPX_05015 [Helicobacter baculiformis]|uniref:Uncharacterized protein n=1 Tax=Helicobacter baculiformis TaxID=427351 RepID=A0ABV7ZKG1_9HELI|nr:hypothetical protein [Helicobacter baculiformis]
MVQKVKNTLYLCKVRFGSEEAFKQLAILPCGAEVVGVNLEIAQELKGAQIDIGLEGQPDYFLKDVDASQKGFSHSLRCFCAQHSQSIYATLRAPLPKGIVADLGAILRVTYFLPSEISIEV